MNVIVENDMKHNKTIQNKPSIECQQRHLAYKCNKQRAFAQITYADATRKLNIVNSQFEISTCFTALSVTSTMATVTKDRCPQ